jgi:hypothetical protein
VAELKQIDRASWSAVVAKATGNPLAEEQILALANNGELIVKGDDDDLYRPIYRDEKWVLDRLVKEGDELAGFLKISAWDARKLLATAGVKPVVKSQELFLTQQLFSILDITSGLRDYVAANGFTSAVAALELGITQASFEQIPPNSIRYTANHRYLKPFVEQFRDIYLPKHTVWSSRTVLLSAFQKNYNVVAQQKGWPLLIPQPCEMDHCDQLAADRCANAHSCRPNGIPRYVCIAHGEWIKSQKPANEKPAVICKSCADRVRANELHGFELFG